MCYLNLFPRFAKQSKEHAIEGTQAEILSALLPQKAGSEVKGGKVFPSPWKWDSSTPEGLEQLSISEQSLVEKSTATFRVFTWEVTSLNRQVLYFSSSRCHTGDRWKKMPGTPQCSKADSQSLWTHSLKAHQKPKSCPGQGSKRRIEEPEMLSLRYKSRAGWEWATFCFALKRSSMWTQRCLSLGCVYGLGGLRSLPHCQASGLFRHGMWCMNGSIHCLSLLMLLLSLGALILCCRPLPRPEKEAASVLIPLYSSSLAKQKARFKARFSAESTNLKQTTISHNKVQCISNLSNYLWLYRKSC